LCQDTRCWYYRSGVDCYRAGGNSCFADSPQGQNREHCLFGANRCIAVSPSDVGTAAVALDAKMVVRGESGERVVSSEEFFIGPAIDITRMTSLKPGEILTAIRIPQEWAGAKFYFEKVTDRATWDFALVSIAAAMVLEGDVVRRSLAWRCRMCRAVKAAESGHRQRAPPTAALAGKSAVQGATFNFNHFKIPLTENPVRRAITTPEIMELSASAVTPGPGSAGRLWDLAGRVRARRDRHHRPRDLPADPQEAHA
jgi:xanthine dehydrogenase YagS FAD-binding subunit